MREEKKSSFLHLPSIRGIFFFFFFFLFEWYEVWIFIYFSFDFNLSFICVFHFRFYGYTLNWSFVYIFFSLLSSSPRLVFFYISIFLHIQQKFAIKLNTNDQFNVNKNNVSAIFYFFYLLSFFFVFFFNLQCLMFVTFVDIFVASTSDSCF